MAKLWSEPYDNSAAGARARIERTAGEDLERMLRGVIAFPVSLTREESGNVTAMVIDVPEARTWGLNEHEALIHARVALLVALEEYKGHGRKLPLPSRVEGSPVVEIPMSVFSEEASEGMLS